MIETSEIVGLADLAVSGLAELEPNGCLHEVDTTGTKWRQNCDDDYSCV